MKAKDDEAVIAAALDQLENRYPQFDAARARASLASLSQELRDAETALTQAIAEIEGSPYQSEPWGWGMATRMAEWKAALASSAEREPESETA